MKTRFHIQYDPKSKERSRELRNNMTKPEKKVWFDYLRHQNVRFLRQKPLDGYIVDFYCASKKLVIEIDGESHFTQDGKEYDEERTAILGTYGLKVIRFTNDEVMNNFEGVCKKIEEALQPSLSKDNKRS